MAKKKKKIEPSRQVVVVPCERPQFWGNRVQSDKLDKEKAKNDEIIRRQQEEQIKKWRTP